MPSSQDGAWQKPFQHTPLSQSFVLSTQRLLSAHKGHASPPQSVSLSVPFFTPSLHVDF
jgi:hypothetical protein